MTRAFTEKRHDKDTISCEMVSAAPGISPGTFIAESPLPAIPVALPLQVA